MEIQEATTFKGAAALQAAGPGWALPGLRVALALQRQSQAQGQPAPCFGDPTSHQAGNLVWMARISPASPPCHPTAPHGHSREHPQLTWDLAVSCTPQGSSSQLQLFKALSPQLQGMMLMPLIPMPSCPSSAPFYPRQCQSPVPLP